MDCFNNTGTFPLTPMDIGPRRKAVMFCHPGDFSNGDKDYIMGRNSFVTAFGSTARQDITNNTVRFACKTNSYGPPGSIFGMCHGKCHKEINDHVHIRLNGSIVSGLFHNPSFLDPICSKFRKEKLQAAIALSEKNIRGTRNSQGQVVNKDYNFLGWIKIIRISDGQEVVCYPFKYEEGLEKARSLWDFPFKHGWCETCKDDLATKCIPEPHRNWGWCLPECDEPKVQKDIHLRAHEAVVDAFVYPDCSKDINIASEFCTAAPIISSFGQIWVLDDTDERGEFFFKSNQLRKLRNDLTFKDDGLDLSFQHTSAVGDICLGDAGGSVWKFMKFRDNTASTARPHKLALLTGVVSRSEQGRKPMSCFYCQKLC